VAEDVTKCLAGIKNILYGTNDQEPQTEMIAQLAQEIYNANLIKIMIDNINRVEFEGKKDIASIFNNLLRRQIGNRSPTVDHIASKSEILFRLINGYEIPDIALNSGMMLRECCRYEELTKLIINSEQLYKFFEYVELSTFDIASDAFLTFRDLLTKHKTLCATFLEQNYDKFFENYQKLLNSDNYVTRRQSLKLLGELLLDRYNFTVMTRYISNPENLKLMMNMLREKSRNIQFEAFHVFKVSVVVFFFSSPRLFLVLSDVVIKFQLQGICCKSKQTQTDHRHITQKQGETHRLLVQFSFRSQ
jgi:calcium binding protein 39